MAEAVFNDLAEEKGLPFQAASAGVAAREGYDMAPYAREALGEIGVRVGDHRSRRITKRMLDDADWILAMGPRHEAEIERILGASEKTRLLAEPSREEVPDPYGLTLFAYRASARQLYGYVEKVIGRMEKEYGAQ